MAKAGSAAFTLLTLDGVNLLGAKVKEFAWKPEAVQEDTTGLGDSWIDQTPTGIRRVTVTQTGQYFDTSLHGLHETLAAMPLPAKTLTWSPAGVLLFQARGTPPARYRVLRSESA